LAGVFVSIFGNVNYEGVSYDDVELENAWSHITTWAELIYAGQNPAPLYVGPNAGTLRTAGDADRTLWMGLGDTSHYSSLGNWDRTEL
jgi:hypothetical protein